LSRGNDPNDSFDPAAILLLFDVLSCHRFVST
jgi:hypothetical protein